MSNENFVCLKNGVLKLDTMELVDFVPEKTPLIQLNAEYFGDVPTPLFDKYLNTLTEGDEQKKQALLEFIGACISNVDGFRFKKALCLIGKANSGKSVIRKVVRGIVGSENCTGTFLSRAEARSLLENCRVADGCEFDDNLSGIKTFKDIMNGNQIRAKRSSKNFSFVYRGMLMYEPELVPYFNDENIGLYDYFLPIRCNKTVPEKQQDKRLDEKILEERNGIVYKALTALNQVIARDYCFTIPDETTRIVERAKSIRSKNKLWQYM